MYGKITIHQTEAGRCTGIELDGQRLPHVRQYEVSNEVGEQPVVTVTLVATVETVTTPDNI